jgi:hypothetical protein
MTKNQLITLMRLWWPAACRGQGWNPADRELRLKVISEAVKRPVTSANDLDSRGDVDRVKAHLRQLASPDSLQAAIDQENAAEAGERRRLLFKVQRFPADYVNKITWDRFHCAYPDELTTPQLRQLATTLTERSRAAKRRRAESEVAR